MNALGPHPNPVPTWAIALAGGVVVVSGVGAWLWIRRRSQAAPSAAAGDAVGTSGSSYVPRPRTGEATMLQMTDAQAEEMARRDREWRRSQSLSVSLDALAAAAQRPSGECYAGLGRKQKKVLAALRGVSQMKKRRRKKVYGLAEKMGGKQFKEAFKGLVKLSTQGVKPTGFHPATIWVRDASSGQGCEPIPPQVFDAIYDGLEEALKPLKVFDADTFLDFLARGSVPDIGGMLTRGGLGGAIGGAIGGAFG